jgi:Spy/CpxP family protein refolding chaperone
MTPWAKRLAVALTISIAGNLLLGGYLIGFTFRTQPSVAVSANPERGRGMGMGRGRGNGPGMGLGLGRGRHAIRAAVEPKESELRAHREAIAQARNRVRDTLVNEPLERNGLEQALASLRAQSQRGQELTHQAIVDAATRATPQQRRELADEFGSGER